MSNEKKRRTKSRYIKIRKYLKHEIFSNWPSSVPQMDLFTKTKKKCQMKKRDLLNPVILK